MAKKVTVALSALAESHFNDLSYSLDLPKGRTTQADIVNHCIEECKAFEDITGDQITNWLMDNYPNQYKEFIAKNNIVQY